MASLCENEQVRKKILDSLLAEGKKARVRIR